MFNINTASVSQFLSEQGHQITKDRLVEFNDFAGPLLPVRYLADQRGQAAESKADVDSMVADDEPTIAWYLVKKTTLEDVK